VRTHLGRVFRDIMRKTRNDANLRHIFAEPLSLAFRVVSGGAILLTCDI